MPSVPNPKQIVADGYNRCGRDYSAVRCNDPSPELSLLVEKLRTPAQSLDIGCGCGIPVTSALAELGSVVGVDLSETQIALARENLPSAELIQGDIMDQQFAAAFFDAVVAFYALFHLPREEQHELLTRVSVWLRPGGYLLATLARSDKSGYTEDDFFGVTMYWSHYQSSFYGQILAQLGFEILHLGVVGHGYRDVPGLPPERHPVVLARRPAN